MHFSFENSVCRIVAFPDFYVSWFCSKALSHPLHFPVQANDILSLQAAGPWARGLIAPISGCVDRLFPSPGCCSGANEDKRGLYKGWCKVPVRAQQGAAPCEEPGRLRGFRVSQSKLRSQYFGKFPDTEKKGSGAGEEKAAPSSGFWVPERPGLGSGSCLSAEPILSSSCNKNPDSSGKSKRQSRSAEHSDRLKSSRLVSTLSAS